MVLMVNYIPRFIFLCKLQWFQGFWRWKKKQQQQRQRALVLNLVEISKDFHIIKKSLKEGLIQSPFVTLNNRIV